MGIPSIRNDSMPRSKPEKAANKVARLLHQITPLSRLEYLLDVLLLVFIAIAVFSSISLLSYTPNDPSWNSMTFPPLPVKNLGGELGAFIAGASVYYLGVVALLIPCFALLVARELFLGRRQTTFATFVTMPIGFLFLIAGTSYFVTFAQTMITIDGLALYSSGTLGLYLTPLALRFLGPWGSLVTGSVLLGAALVLISRKRLISNLLRFLVVQPLVVHRNLEKLLGFFRKRSTRFFSSSQYGATSNEGPSIDSNPNIPFVPIVRPEQEENAGVFARSEAGHLVTEPDESVHATGALIVRTLQEFGIEGEIIGLQRGPTLTVYEFQPSTGVKLAKVLSAADDLALSLRTESILITPVRGKRALGIEVPNNQRETVLLGDLLVTPEYLDRTSPLTCAIGKTTNGTPICQDLADMPHLLIAGATGSGKSVCLNTLICSILARATPNEVRMLLIDPKLLELSVYNGIPHLLMPVITEVKQALGALHWAADEMERRYSTMQDLKVRDIREYNRVVGQKNLRSRFETLPYIVVIVDELADLMLSFPKELETAFQKLAQKSRAAGIHLIFATQRPSVDIITGKIKANLPSRISFQVTSRHDSRTILDQCGAEKLLGKGDLLFQTPGAKPRRVQGAYVSEQEISRLVARLAARKEPAFDRDLMRMTDQEGEDPATRRSISFPSL